MSTTSRDAAWQGPLAAAAEERARQALALMVDALEMIDESEGAGVAGAHLDLAIHRLQEWIDGSKAK